MDSLSDIMKEKFDSDEVLARYNSIKAESYLSALFWIRENHPEWLEGAAIAKSCGGRIETSPNVSIRNMVVNRLMDVTKKDDGIHISLLKGDDTESFWQTYVIE